MINDITPVAAPSTDNGSSITREWLAPSAGVVEQVAVEHRTKSQRQCVRTLATSRVREYGRRQLTSTWCRSCMSEATVRERSGGVQLYLRKL